MEEKLTLTTEWDKTFPKSDTVNHRKITFHNRYGITLAADLYEPKMRLESFRPSPYADRLALSRNRRPVSMRRPWRREGF